MTESTLLAQIKDGMKDAMRAQEKERLGVIRLVLAAVKQVEVDQRIELDDAAVLAILDKMVKQRRESIKQYESAGRQDLADKEAAEITVIQGYLPQALTEAELLALIDKGIAETGAAGMAGMGKLMAWLKPQVQGRADMGAVSVHIKAKLAV
ncbi:MAG: GatB/YqeY domain-containing protein [Gammaproteobacteria bacterium]|nr:GatB/YqeY domain-containing protein [Gammaproteobacteria bacterium]